MDDLISRQAVKEWLERWEGYLDKDMIARMQLKVADIPTHPTPSNTLDALDCVDRQAAIKAICESECGALKPCEAECETIWAVKELPSTQSKLDKYSPKLDNENGELISRQEVIAEFSCCELTPDGGIDANYAIDFLEQLPSVQTEDWMARNKERILQAGMEGQEIEFRIGGRLFAIREKAQ